MTLPDIYFIYLKLQVQMAVELNKIIMTEFLSEKLMALPDLILPKMEADQKTSETAAGKACNAPHFPYFWVKGSTMVT